MCYLLCKFKVGHAIHGFGVVFPKGQHGGIGFAIWGISQNVGGALLHSGPCCLGFLQLCFANSRGGHVLYVLGHQDPRDTMVMSTLCFVQHKVGHGASSVHHLNSFAPLLYLASTSVHVELVHLLIQVLFHV